MFNGVLLTDIFQQTLESPDVKSQHVNEAATVLLSPFTSLITLQYYTTSASLHRGVSVCVSVWDTPSTLKFQGVSCWRLFFSQSLLHFVSETNPALCVSLCVCASGTLRVHMWLFSLAWMISEDTAVSWEEVLSCTDWQEGEELGQMIAWLLVWQAVQLCGCHYWKMTHVTTAILTVYSHIQHRAVKCLNKDRLIYRIIN